MTIELHLMNRLEDFIQKEKPAGDNSLELRRVETVARKAGNLGNPVNRFFILCSGASRQCLLESPESEINKYANIGFIILLTAIFAFFSGGYAIWTVFPETVVQPLAANASAAGRASDNELVFIVKLLITIFFSILWGLMIFTIDRYLVSTMVNTKNKLYNFLRAMPRLILAVIISFTIAHPLKLRIFEEEINDSLYEQSEDRKKQVKKEYEDKRKALAKEFAGKLSAAKKDIASQIIRAENLRSLLEKQKEDAEKKRKEARDEYVCECDGTCGTMRQGDGPECKRKREVYKPIAEAHDRTVIRLEQEIIDASKNYAKLISKETADEKNSATKLDAELKNLEQNRQTRLQGTETHFSTSLLSRSKALFKVTNETDANIMSWFITILFIMVEIAPVLSKLMSSAGSYDWLIEKENALANSALKRKQEAYKHLHKKKQHEYKVNALMWRVKEYEQSVEEARIKAESQETIENIKAERRQSDTSLLEKTNRIIQYRMNKIIDDWEKTAFPTGAYIDKLASISEESISSRLSSIKEKVDDLNKPELPGKRGLGVIPALSQPASDPVPDGGKLAGVALYQYMRKVMRILTLFVRNHPNVIWNIWVSFLCFVVAISTFFLIGRESFPGIGINALEPALYASSAFLAIAFTYSMFRKKRINETNETNETN